MTAEKIGSTWVIRLADGTKVGAFMTRSQAEHSITLRNPDGTKAK